MRTLLKRSSSISLVRSDARAFSPMGSRNSRSAAPGTLSHSARDAHESKMRFIELRKTSASMASWYPYSPTAITVLVKRCARPASAPCVYRTFIVNKSARAFVGHRICMLGSTVKYILRRSWSIL